MAIMITEECIVCGACEAECPNNAIYEQGVGWRWSEGTNLSGESDMNGKTIKADTENPAISDDFYYIVPGKCTECKGFHDEPQCAVACPVDCCVPDPDRIESSDVLLDRKRRLHY